MNNESLESLYRKWLLDMWNGNVALAAELVTPDFVVHQARIDGQASDAMRGPEAVRQMIEQGRASFDDLTFSIEVGPLVDGEMVSARWIGRGTYAGGAPGATAEPGTEVVFRGIDILRVEDGRFAEYWVSSDTHHLMAQLGAL